MDDRNEADVKNNRELFTLVTWGWPAASLNILNSSSFNAISRWPKVWTRGITSRPLAPAYETIFVTSDSLYALCAEIFLMSPVKGNMSSYSMRTVVAPAEAKRGKRFLR